MTFSVSDAKPALTCFCISTWVMHTKFSSLTEKKLLLPSKGTTVKRGFCINTIVEKRNLRLINGYLRLRWQSSSSKQREQNELEDETEEKRKDGADGPEKRSMSLKSYSRNEEQMQTADKANFCREYISNMTERLNRYYRLYNNWKIKV